MPSSIPRKRLSMTNDVSAWRLEHLATALRSRAISPIEVTARYLARIEELNPSINAFITVLADEARAEASRAEYEIAHERYLGPLHGIPFAAKDVFLTSGVRTTCGSRALSQFVPTTDAALVTRLRGAGAILVGKLNMHEFAFGVTSDNPHFGAVRNPVDTTRIAGGSSGGSAAAVAAALVPLALGTDTGGSIRIPSALCGVAGLKPTFGRLSRQGIYPLCHSLDHPGLLAATAADLALAMKVVDDQTQSRPPRPQQRADIAMSASPDLDGVTIGVPDSYFFDNLEPAVADSLRDALDTLRGLGAVLTPVSIPHLPEAAVAASVTLLSEAATTLEKWHRQKAEELGPDILFRLELGAGISARQYLKAQHVRAVVRAAFATVFEDVDALVTPQLPITAPLLGQSLVTPGHVEEAVPDALTRLTRIFNFTGIPAVSVPCGRSGAGLPIALQLVGAAGQDFTPLRIGQVYERAVAATH